MCVPSAPPASGQAEGEKRDTITVRGAIESSSVRQFVVNGSGVQVRSTAAQLADYREVAKEIGEPFSVLAERFQGQDEFSLFATTLQLENADIFGTAGVSPDQSQSDFYLYLSAALPTALQAKLARQPYRTLVRIGNTLSTSDRYQIGDALSGSIADDPDVRHVSTELSPDGSHLVIRYDPSDSVDRISFTQNAVREAANRLGIRELPTDVEFVVEDNSHLVLEATVKGGYGLFQGTTPVCTSGFSANRSGNLGVVTANHCHPVEYTASNPNILGNPGTAATPAGGGNIDMRFYPTLNPHNTTNMFRWTVGAEQGVLSAANPMAGMSICHYGITSDRRCGVVGNTTDYCEEGFCGLYRTTEYISGGGDSGGPWYSPNAARGIHLGAREINNVPVASVFTGIGRVSNNLNATILQQ